MSDIVSKYIYIYIYSRTYRIYVSDLESTFKFCDTFVRIMSLKDSLHLDARANPLNVYASFYAVNSSIFVCMLETICPVHGPVLHERPYHYKKVCSSPFLFNPSVPILFHAIHTLIYGGETDTGFLSH